MDASGGGGAAARPGSAAVGLRLRATLTGHTEAVTAVRFSHDGTLLATVSGDRTIKVWSVADGTLSTTIGDDPATGHKLGISDVAWSHDSTLLASCSDDRTVKIWDRSTGTMRHSLMGHSNFVVSVDFHPKTYEVASGSYDAKVLQWDGDKGKCTKIIPKHKSPVASVRYSPDGRFILSTSYDGSCNVFNAATGDVALQVVAGVSPIICGSWSGPQGKFILLNCLDSTAQLWTIDLSNGPDSKPPRVIRTYKGHKNAKYALFSLVLQASKVVVSASEDGSVYCWNIQTAALSSKTSAHQGVILGLDARGSVVATAGLEDNTAKIWEIGA